MTMRRVLLSGDMAKRFGTTHTFDVRTAGEAFRALCATQRGFNAYLYDAAKKGLGFEVFVDDDPLSPDLLEAPAGHSDIRIAPVVTGASDKGLFYIAAAVALAVATEGFSTGITAIGMSASTAGMLALSLTISGISQLMSQTPKLDRNEKAAPPYNFSGPVNTTAQGNPVPVVYGELIVGSCVISADITTNDIPVPPLWEREL